MYRNPHSCPFALLNDMVWVFCNATGIAFRTCWSCCLGWFRPCEVKAAFGEMSNKVSQGTRFNNLFYEDCRMSWTQDVQELTWRQTPRILAASQIFDNGIGCRTTTQFGKLWGSCRQVSLETEERFLMNFGKFSSSLEIEKHLFTSRCCQSSMFFFGFGWMWPGFWNSLGHLEAWNNGDSCITSLLPMVFFQELVVHESEHRAVTWNREPLWCGCFGNSRF